MNILLSLFINFPVTMFRILVLSVFFTVSVASSIEYRQKCIKLGHPDSLHCCKSGIPEPEVSPDALKECIETPHSPLSCERDLCIAKKRGYASDDGTLDKDAFEDIVTKDFKNSPVLAAVLKEKCIKGDVAKYGPAQLCQLIKINRCINEYFLLECAVWDNSGNTACNDLRKLTKECAAMSN